MNLKTNRKDYITYYYYLFFSIYYCFQRFICLCGGKSKLENLVNTFGLAVYFTYQMTKLLRYKMLSSKSGVNIWRSDFTYLWATCSFYARWSFWHLFNRFYYDGLHFKNFWWIERQEKLLYESSVRRPLILKILWIHWLIKQSFQLFISNEQGNFFH